MSTVREDPSRDEVADTAASSPGSDGQGGEGHHLLELWSDRQEVHALPEILRPAEGLVAVGSGTVLRSGRLAQSRWLVVLTDRRLLCIKGRQAVTRKVIDMPVSAVRSVSTSGLWRKTLVLETGYGTLRISGMKKNVAAEMVEGLTALTNSFGVERGDGQTAIRRAELPDKDAASTGPSAEAVAGIEEKVAAMAEELNELKDQVSFLEGLVHGNVKSQPDTPMEQS